MPAASASIAVGRIAQHVLRAHDDRRVGFGDAEMLEQLVDVRVRLEIDPGKEHEVLGQEVADAKRVRRVARADHAQARERARLAHQLTAGHECAQDDVAQIRALVDDLLEELARDRVDLAVAEGHGGDRSPACRSGARRRR